MPRRSIAAIPLRPTRDVQGSGGALVATSPEPWLEIVLPSVERLAGRFVEITYQSSFWDEPVRPVFRFWQCDGTCVDRIAAGPVAGAAIWTGRVPTGTQRIEVSPTNRLGLFGFRIERIQPLSWPTLMARGIRCQPRRARSAFLTWLIGWRPESDVNLSWATGAISPARFPKWCAERAKDLDLDGLDAPRFDWRTAAPIEVAVGTGEGGLTRRSLASLEAQIFPHWIASFPAGCGIEANDSRVRLRPPEGSNGLDDADGTLTCRIEAGDVLAPAALACIAEQAHRHPACKLFYADALLVDERGVTVPLFHPGWSPRFFAARPPRDALIVVRDLKRWPPGEQDRFLHEGWLHDLSSLGSKDVRPLRRILVEKQPKRGLTIPVVPRGSGKANVSVVIPTRDHPALLRRAIESIRRSGEPRPQIVIVDNGSTTDPARRLLAELARLPGILCLSHSGAFNFSKMCNDGAAAADGDVLVFLNDDTEILTGDWLGRLSVLATEPTIGAVGARLTYPDGRLQHVGVLLGMGESAGHFGALSAVGDPGWAARNTAVHEVSAVTGACLAVARSKFEAVGGFDAEHLPVELSDVDLCLKLNARGWQTMVDPSVHLMHEESASRGGATFRRLDVYAAQRAVFTERWRHVLRDDPFFHPGLSLYSFEPALA